MAGAYSGSPQVCDGFGNPFLRKCLARISTFKRHEVGRIWATVSERKGAQKQRESTAKSGGQISHNLLKVAILDICDSFELSVDLFW